jgi:hypothetical protein
VWLEKRETDNAVENSFLVYGRKVIFIAES